MALEEDRPDRFSEAEVLSMPAEELIDYACVAMGVNISRLAALLGVRYSHAWKWTRGEADSSYRGMRPHVRLHIFHLIQLHDLRASIEEAMDGKPAV